MSISAKVLADTWFRGSRLTTFELVYPRFILAEVNTHRQLSRNSASSRAIPIDAMVEAVKTDPAGPVFWGRNQAGMVAAEELIGFDLEKAKGTWAAGAYSAIWTAKELQACGVHKSIANRCLEPWFWVKTVLSATEWPNFYVQRTDKAAEPSFQALAEAMLAAHNASVPVRVEERDGGLYWHLPYVTPEERGVLNLDDQRCVSAARCARVSYTRHGQVKDLEEDRLRVVQMVDMRHWSPLEHVAVALQGQWGNYKNFCQWRKYFAPRECETEFPGLLDPFRDRDKDEVTHG
jgi:hypothetical protein